MKKLLILVLMFCFALIGCFDSGGGSSKNKCAGPVPCLATNWGNQYAVFLDNTGSPFVLQSDGEIVAVICDGTIGGEICVYGFAGPVINCYNANIDYGAVDSDLDGFWDIELSGVTGNLRVCGEILKIVNIVSNEVVFNNDVVATFDNMASLSASNHLSTDGPISAENVEKVKIRIKLLEQLMEE